MSVKLKTVVEEVLKCHFDENELLPVSKSLQVRKYFDKILDDLAPSQQGSCRGQVGVKISKCFK